MNDKVILLIPKIKGGFNSEKIKEAIACEGEGIPYPISLDGTVYNLNAETSFFVHDTSSGDGFNASLAEFKTQPQSVDTILITHLRTYKNQNGTEMLYPHAELALFWHKLLVEEHSTASYSFKFFVDRGSTDSKEIPGYRYTTYSVDQGVAQKIKAIYVNSTNYNEEKLGALKVWNENEPKSIA
jgi:hypothetical protein